MLSPRLRPMLDSTMEDMVLDMLVLDMLVLAMPDFTMEDMDTVLDMLVLAMPDLDMLDMDMDILPTDTPPLDTMARGLLMLSPRPRLMLDSTMEDMAMVLAILVLVTLDMDIPLMVDTVDTTMVRSLSKCC